MDKQKFWEYKQVRGALFGCGERQLAKLLLLDPRSPSPAAVAEGRSCRWVWRKLGQSPGEGPADRDTPIYGEITEAGMLAIYSKWWPATDGA